MEKFSTIVFTLSALLCCFLAASTVALECFDCKAVSRLNASPKEYTCASEDRTALQEYLRLCRPGETVCKFERFFSNDEAYADSGTTYASSARLRRSCSPPPTEAKYTLRRWHNVTKEGKESTTEVFYCNTDQCLASDKSSASNLHTSCLLSLLAIAGLLSKHVAM
ncbi:hypothetical protein RvY_16430 [Ramazzottius varieornatus]|uniref:UPAR/Ly6 domain-containing protein n=1 Tax=Ramazzottius varieornatus TaxID=947166 RepID=A0A1D1VZP7_RAMVA|nr:hypothetical protein RvY_16430 [Ramazzottius varieornatus]